MKSVCTISDLCHRLQAKMLDYLARWCNKNPLRRRKKLASLLTLLAFRGAGIRRNLMIRNLMLHLDLNQTHAAKLAEKVFYQFLLNSFAMAPLRYISGDQLKKSVQVNGYENLQAALKQNKGAIIVSAHFGLWELIPAWLAAEGHQVTIVVRRQNNKYVDKWFEEMRHTHGPRTTDSGFAMREILRTLRQGNILALMVDQDNGKQGIFVKFFNKFASAPIGPAQISLRTGAPIVPLAIFPQNNAPHMLQILQPVYPETFDKSSECQQQMTQLFTTELEKIIRRSPHQWFWLHRRWKTQPQDAPDNQWAKHVLSL